VLTFDVDDFTGVETLAEIEEASTKTSTESNLAQFAQLTVQSSHRFTMMDAFDELQENTGMKGGLKE
jgi:hypothetical protein